MSVKSFAKLDTNFIDSLLSITVDLLTLKAGWTLESLSEVIFTLAMHTRSKAYLHCPSFCDHSRNFACVNSKIKRICKKFLGELTQCLTVSQFRKFRSKVWFPYDTDTRRVPLSVITHE
jgi:hypothetical protein